MWAAHLRGEETSLNPLGMAEALIGAMNHAAILAGEPEGGEIQTFTARRAAALGHRRRAPRAPPTARPVSVSRPPWTPVVAACGAGCARACTCAWFRARARATCAARRA